MLLSSFCVVLLVLLCLFVAWYGVRLVFFVVFLEKLSFFGKVLHSVSSIGFRLATTYKASSSFGNGTKKMLLCLFVFAVLRCGHCVFLIVFPSSLFAVNPIGSLPYALSSTCYH